MVQVSAKKRENLDTLLETILLTSDILNLRASPTRLASGVVLEAKLDRGRGAVATVLVQQGTLRVRRSVHRRTDFRQGSRDVQRSRRSQLPKLSRRLRLKYSDFKAFRRPVIVSRSLPTSLAPSRFPSTVRC